MLQKAKVISTNGSLATIAVSRSTMCEGCEKNKNCGGHCEITGLIANDESRTVRTAAQNPIGAVPGDVVEVESSSGRVLGYAALVFILPILVCAFGFALGRRIFTTDGAGYLCALAGFALTFVLIAVYDRAVGKKTPQITIVRRLEAAETEAADIPENAGDGEAAGSEADEEEFLPEEPEKEDAADETRGTDET